MELIDDSGELATLQSSLAGALADGGWYQPEHRRFLAHVTVARTGRNGPRHPSELPPSPALPVVVPSVSLYRSHIGPSGARYEPLETVALLPDAPG